MNQMEILLEEKTELKIGEKKYLVGSFSYEQITAIGKWLINVAGKTTVELKGKTNQEDLLKLLSVADNESAADFFSIILDDKDTDYIKKNILSSGKVFSSVLNIILDLNEEFFRNFSIVAGKMNAKKTETLPQSSSK